MTLITLIIESFLSSEQITLTLSVQRPYLLTYSYNIALLYSLGCIRPKPNCRTLITLITLIKESFLSSEQITLTLSVQRPYLLVYSYDIVLLYSLGCIHPIPTCQTLITLITLLTESFLTIWTDTVQLPVNGPCKSRYLAINVICTIVLSLNIQLYNCIAVFPRLHPNTTYMPNTDDTDYTDNRVVFIIWTDNVNAICTTTISSDIQLWYCIAVFPRLYPSNTYLPNTDYTDYTDNRVVFIIWTDNVNAICTPTISSHIQLWCCIAVFPRLYSSNTYLPNTDYTDYTDNRVVFIIWTDNVNAICTTTISSDIQIWYCIAVFHRLYLYNNYLPNTDYTDYTDNRVVFIIWTDNVNAICTPTISSHIQLWCCIAVFPRLYSSNTYLPNTDYTDYTDNRAVFIIWTDNVNAICATTISSNLQLRCCIVVFPRVYLYNTYLPNTDYTDYTAYRVVCNHLHR